MLMRVKMTNEQRLIYARSWLAVAKAGYETAFKTKDKYTLQIMKDRIQLLTTLFPELNSQGE